ncbi:MAG: alpha-glucosidase [Candidatus Ordinivivax streblomastigis]|uniref:Alpha-glucosidase n=2 Tax=Candidatus Ordinivivax streblomastigis TaxID=2540710 RepID=A0A5M8NSR7_9BACT|nr:MAG: alpha-glucosidase [Candidatus Ordinivivax streblomastigis]
MKHIIYTLLLMFSLSVYAKDYTVTSPNGQLQLTLHVDKKAGTTYELRHGNTLLLNTSTIGMRLEDGRIIGRDAARRISTRSVSGSVPVLFGKNKNIAEVYNELTITYKADYDLIVRAYNEGVAYRFVTRLPGNIIIANEDAIFHFAGNPSVYYPQSPDLRNFEKTYVICKTIKEINPASFSVGPILFDYPNTPYKLVITEADTYDYPGLYVEPNGENSVKGMWASVPKIVEDPKSTYSNHLPIVRQNYIANTSGTRTFPWRVLVVSDDDKSLLNNDLVYLLAEPSRLTDTSWIKPGKTAWEWWHKAMLDDVEIPFGNKNLGLDLYKYYVDFASKNQLEYMTLDAGWKESYIQELCEYAATKNVKIFVWTWASMAVEDLTFLPRMKEKGVYGLKIDFFERNDQVAMTWGHSLAQRLADLQMVALYHGCPMPTGLNRTYPNILNFEAVRGAECNFWDRGSNPEYHVQFPFIRLLAGPADYTPGSFRNQTKDAFFPVDQPNIIPSTMGTRAHELAMYIVFDHWLAYLCDAPTEYEKHPALLEFLSGVPTVWDKTLPLDAQLGEYIVTAKQKGDEWYVGGMTNWTSRNSTVDLSFLPAGKNYSAQIYKDGANADMEPTAYDVATNEVNSATKLSIKMASGGGFVVRLRQM